MKEHVAEIVSAYLSRNRIDPSELSPLIVSVSQALGTLGKEARTLPAAPTPAVPIRRSVSAKAIICLECGWSGQLLKRHLGAAHDMTVDGYRSRWDLSRDYPMVAKNYAARRSQLAKDLGLGRMKA
jgi:predicted transcriptional regulator